VRWVWAFKTHLTTLLQQQQQQQHHDTMTPQHHNTPSLLQNNIGSYEFFFCLIDIKLYNSCVEISI
jgi:plastocyanin